MFIAEMHHLNKSEQFVLAYRTLTRDCGLRTAVVCSFFQLASLNACPHLYKVLA